MNIIISGKSEKPIYEQIKYQIKKAIILGQLKKDSPLPGLRSLASDLKVSVITTKRAYSELENEGLIYTVAGKGSFVSSIDKEIFYEEGIEKIEEKFKDIIIISQDLKLSKKDLFDILENLYKI